MSSTTKRFGKLDFIKQMMRSAFVRDTFRTLNQCDILLFRHDKDCSYEFQDKAYAHLIDSFGELCTKRSLKVQSIAKPFSLLVGSRAQYSPVSYCQAYKNTMICAQLLQLIQGEDVATEWKRSNLVALWCGILDKAKPKIVVGIQPDEYLCRAGKIKKIPVYDLQHGVINDDHPWYGIKYQISKPIEALPDGFLCWDDQAVATIKKWGDNKGIVAINVGNPWFIRFNQKNPNDYLVREALAKLNEFDINRPCILVSLQWGLTEPIVSALERVILDTINIYNWNLRLHPVQVRDAWKADKKQTMKYLTDTFGDKKTQKWLKSSQIPLPIALQQSDLHITYSSTVVIEAAWMGVRSAILNQDICNGGKSDSYYSYERSKGLADVIPQDPTIIKQWIADNLTKGRAELVFGSSCHAFDVFIDEILALHKQSGKD